MFFVDLIQDHYPGGPTEDTVLLTSIHDRPDPWEGHPYRVEQNRDGWYRWSEEAIRRIVNGDE